jgi:hypothetical protein
MIPPGIYVMKELDALVDEMSGKLDGFSGLKCEGILPRGTAGSERIVTVRILARKDGWCRLELSGDEDGTAAVMEFLTGLQSLKKVLVWDSSIDAQEYSYSLFQEGKLLEQFSVKGPALEVASFVSELRRPSGVSGCGRTPQRKSKTGRPGWISHFLPDGLSGEACSVRFRAAGDGCRREILFLRRITRNRGGIVAVRPERGILEKGCLGAPGKLGSRGVKPDSGVPA